MTDQTAELTKAQAIDFVLHFYTAEGLEGDGGIDEFTQTDRDDIEFVLVERNKEGARGFYLTPCDSLDDAATHHLANEYDDWEPTCAVGIPSLQVYEPIPSMSWIPTTQFIPRVAVVELDDQDEPLYSLTWGDIREVLASDADDESKIEALVQGFRTVIVQAAAQTVLSDSGALSTAFPPPAGRDPSQPPGDGDQDPHGALTAPWEAPTVDSHPMPPAEVSDGIQS